MNTTFALPQLAEQFATLTATDNETAEKFIKVFFNQIENALSVSENVTIKGLGTFIRNDDPENPISFIPDKDLAAALNQPFEMFSAIEVDDDIKLETSSEPQQQPEPEISVLDEIIAMNEEPEPDVTEEFKPLIGVTSTKPVSEPESESATEPEATPSIIEIQETSQLQEHEYHPVAKDRSTTKMIFIFVIGLILGFLGGYLMHKFTNVTIEAENATIIVEDKSEADLLVTDSIATAIETEENIIETEPEVIPEPVYDTVTTERFLTTLARKYYGQMEYWVFIYKANEDILGNPNRIKPGTRVRIPDKSEFASDETPEQTLARAKSMGEDIYSRF